MFSVLIPVQNYDVEPLVLQVLQAATHADVDVEIIVRDDGSTEEFCAVNHNLVNKYGIKHLAVTNDEGRSRNRNELARVATQPWLIFIDADSAATEDYLLTYAAHCKEHLVLVGGTSYSTNSPDGSELLRWTYGREREMVSAKLRNEHPYHSFAANNFCIERNTFFEVLFDEEIENYGHEDTLFGIELRQKGIEVLHLDNPVEHLGLENAARFIEKTKEGVRTLASLYHAKKLQKEDVRLLQFYLNFKPFGLKLLFRILGNSLAKKAEKQLKSPHPTIAWLDVIKLNELYKLA